MEKQLFTWRQWDDIGNMLFVYYGITLVVDIGNHKAGENFPEADLNYGSGELTLFKDQAEKGETFKLKLVVEA